MILYHGSSRYFEKFDLSKARGNKDFGRGFYLTTDPEQARVWAIKFGHGFLYKYSVEDKVLEEGATYKIRKLVVYNQEWLDFVIRCRKESYESGDDIIYDRMADSRYKDLSKALTDYYRGQISAEEALLKVAFRARGYDQYCFKTSEVIDLLKRQDFYEVSK